jgi:hypothetical protein
MTLDNHNNKIAFIILAINQKYIDIAEITCKKLLEYMDADVILYYANGTVKPYVSNRLKKINLAIYNFDFDYITYPTPLKPFIAKETLKEYDTVINLDSDIQVTPNIIQVKKHFFNKDPIFTRYCDNDMYLIWYLTDGSQLKIHWCPDELKKYINFERHDQIKTLFTGFFIVNKNHFSLMDEWYNLYFEILNIKDPKVYTYQIKHLLNEESILNALILKYKITTYLQPRFVHTAFFEGMQEVYDTLNGKIPFAPSSTNYEYAEVKFKYLNHNFSYNLCVFSKEKDNVWGAHTSKDIDVINKIYEIIDENHVKY